MGKPESMMMACPTWLLAVLPSLWPQHPQQGPVSPPESPFDSIDRRSSLIEVDRPGVEGWGTYFMRLEQIRIAWKRDFSKYLPETQSPPSLSYDGGFTSDQYVDIDYWPTEVCGLGVNEMCVAGKTVDGRTKVEVWRFRTTDDLGDPRTDESGRIHYPATAFSVESRRVLYDAIDDDKGLVRAILRNHGDGTKAWVLFAKSDDLFSMDLTSGATTVALTVAQQPRLAAGFYDRWSANHSTGYMYALASRGPSGGTLLLFDRDRNGTLDDSSFLVGSEWFTGAVDYSKFEDYLKRY